MVLANPIPFGSYLTSSQLIEDLSLALKHNHQVLLVNHSQLQHSLYAIVYINVSRVKQSEEEIINVFWKVFTEMIQEEKRKKNEAEAMIKSNDESDEEQSVSEDDEDVIYKFPLLVVGVPGLPRDASLEIEVIGLGDNYLPTIKRKENITAITFSSQQINQQACSILPLPVLHEKLSDEDIMSCQSDVISYPRCFLAGTIRLHPNITTLAPKMSLMTVCESLISSLIESFSTYEMKKSTLSTLVIFHSSTINATILGELINKELGKNGFVNTIPIVLPFPYIPCTSPCLLKVLFYGIDFHQIETQHWIYSEN
jgi:hypothetical protein